MKNEYIFAICATAFFVVYFINVCVKDFKESKAPDKF